MVSDLVALVAAVRSVLADPTSEAPATGDAALDRALEALVAQQLQGPALPYWFLQRMETVERIALQ